MCASVPRESILLISVCFLIITTAFTPSMATDKCGAVCDETWNVAGSPYVLTCDVTVASGCTLAIDAGVHVSAQAGYGLIVDGTLDANGGSGNEVVFTSDAGTPSAGDWLGVTLQTAASGTLDYTTVEYAVDGIFVRDTAGLTGNEVSAGYSSSQGVYGRDSAVVNLTGGSIHHNNAGIELIDSATATMIDVSVTDNTNSGIFISQGSSATLTGLTCTGNRDGVYVYVNTTALPTTATGCTITGNQYGMRVRGLSSDPDVTITGSSIHSNTTWDYYGYNFINADTTVLDATGNWWGTTDETAIRSHISDHATNISYAMVDWCGYLDGPAGSEARPNVYCADLSICDETVAWNQTDQPYILYTDAVVCPTGTLEIGPDVVVRSVQHSGVGIEVLGTLDVNGTSGHEAIFTSDVASPAAGDWQGIALHGNGTATVDHATVDYVSIGFAADDTSELTLTETALSQCTSNGVDGSQSAIINLTGGSIASCSQGFILYNDATATLTGTTISDNTNAGVYLQHASSATLTDVTMTGGTYGIYVYVNATAPPSTATGCTLTGNNYGVRVRGSASDPDFTITDSSIHSNSLWNYHANAVIDPDTAVLDATGNWWGTTDTSAIRGAIFDHANSVSSAPMVDWCGYLNAEGGSIARPNVYCADLSVCDDTVVWDQTDQPYLLLSDTVICPTGVLRIEQDVDVLIAPHSYAGFEVLGSLDVNGLAGHEVSFGPDTGSPSAGDWQGIALHGNGTATVDHATIDYVSIGFAADDTSELTLTETALSQCTSNGVDGSQSAIINLTGGSIASCSQGFILYNDATATLTGTTISDNTNAGVYLLHASSATLTDVTMTGGTYGIYVYVNATAPPSTATGCTLTGNNYGVRVRGSSSDPDFTITDSSIHSNSLWDYHANYVLNPDTTVLDATGNWWGTTDESDIRAKITDHADSSNIGPMVNWCGYLDGPGGSAARTDVYCVDLSVCGATEVWDQTDQPYLLISDVVICPTGTLRIEQDVEVRTVLHSGAGIESLGVLDVNGTAGHPVTFTADRSTPAAGDWQGLMARDNGSATVDHATVIYGADGLAAYDTGQVFADNVTMTDGTRAGVYAEDSATVGLTDTTIRRYIRGTELRLNATATLTDVDIAECTDAGVWVYQQTSVQMNRVNSSLNGYGLYVYPTAGAPPTRVWGSRFVGNTVDGIRLRGNSSAPDVSVTGSTIHSNASYDLYTQAYINPDTSLAWVPDNWWGTTDIDTIRLHVYDHEDTATSPTAYFAPLGADCGRVLAGDQDGDGYGDFEDDCPVDEDVSQTDTDFDGMGDVCDPAPTLEPTGPCNGVNDVTDGYADADADGWGDLCDFQPTRADSYPGATEICDGRDNDGDGQFAAGELTDGDLDVAFTCADCDDTEPLTYPCACERCTNTADDDCDGDGDVSDSDCSVSPYCIVVGSMGVSKGACGGATTASPSQVIRGFVEQLEIAGGSCDLGNVECVDPYLVWDRVTDNSRDPNPRCDETAMFYLSRPDGASDFGAASTGEPRDVMNPNPPCP